MSLCYKGSIELYYNAFAILQTKLHIALSTEICKH